MTHEELIAFRDNVALPKLLELFDNTQIPEGACYVDSITISFLDGRSCGHETYYEASGFQYLDGKVQKYKFEEVDEDFQFFAEAHKDCVFVSDGKLQVIDELNELDLTTTIRNLNTCKKLFPELGNSEDLNLVFSPVPYYKMEYLWNNRTDVVDMDTHDFKIEGFMGTWHTTDHVELNGSTYYLMECETYGVELPGIIVDASGKVVLEDVLYGIDDELIQDLNDTLLADKLYAEVAQQLMDKENETAYGEPQAWVYFDNGRSIEITLEQEMLPPDEHYYSIRLHCNEKEFDGGEYRGTEGIISQYNTKSNSLDEVKRYLYSAIICNDNYPVEEYYRMDEPAEDLQAEHKPLDAMIQAASSRVGEEKDSPCKDKEAGR